MGRILKGVFGTGLVLLACGIWSETKADEPKTKSADVKTPKPEELEKKFQELMTGAMLVGRFTEEGGQDGPPKEERYTIESVNKLQGDLWLFKSRIQYGQHDLTLPLPLRVVWAGDTPVITLDNVPVPGLGSFTARVMIFDGKYAGTWSGGDHGGLLFGKVIKARQ